MALVRPKEYPDGSVAYEGNGSGIDWIDGPIQHFFGNGDGIPRRRGQKRCIIEGLTVRPLGQGGRAIDIRYQHDPSRHFPGVEVHDVVTSGVEDDNSKWWEAGARFENCWQAEIEDLTCRGKMNDTVGLGLELVRCIDCEISRPNILFAAVAYRAHKHCEGVKVHHFDFVHAHIGAQIWSDGTDLPTVQMMLESGHMNVFARGAQADGVSQMHFNHTDIYRHPDAPEHDDWVALDVRNSSVLHVHGNSFIDAKGPHGRRDHGLVMHTVESASVTGNIGHQMDAPFWNQTPSVGILAESGNVGHWHS